MTYSQHDSPILVSYLANKFSLSLSISGPENSGPTYGTATSLTTACVNKHFQSHSAPRDVGAVEQFFEFTYLPDACKVTVDS